MSNEHDVFLDRQIAHDLAGQLNTIKLLAELLVRTGATDADALDMLGEIVEAADAALTLLGGPMSDGDVAVAG